MGVKLVFTKVQRAEPPCYNYARITGIKYTDGPKKTFYNVDSNKAGMKSFTNKTKALKYYNSIKKIGCKRKK